MKYIQLSNTKEVVSNIVMGCMRINQLSVEEINHLINTALERGVNYFDHADIYGGGECETLFGKAFDLKSVKREKMLIQSKCGIRNGYYDLSKDYIVSSVDGILNRLNTDYLDVLLLHRPDALMDPEEIADAFSSLKANGKVRYFGVSNFTKDQIELLQNHCSMKIIINQVQFSAAHTYLIDSGMAFNMGNEQSVNRGGSTLDYCRLNNVTMQAWSPFQKGMFEGVFLNDHDKYAKLNEVIDRLAKKYNVTNSTIAVAFITRHPANMQVVLGTTNANRFKECVKGSSLALTREEWYEIYRAAGKLIP
ncbi:oxidoreductase, aldo/keto reductase family [Lachnospiraceae bacterium KM106-2]|nr:oxidoreductase, aldo/keto reductase family [Lachnospiraceae bacterium KM106-2]